MGPGNFLFVLLPFFFLGLTRCGDALKEPYQLGELRVLAIKATPPEAAPGDSSTLVPLISDLDGAGRALTYTVETCPDPGFDLGKDPNCDSSPSKQVVVSETSVTPLTGPYYTGTADSFSVTIPTDILNNRTVQQQNNGFAFIVVYTLKAGSQSVRSFKRVFASTKTPKNENPTLSKILSEGAELLALPTADSTLSAEFTGTAAESFPQIQSDGSSKTIQEDLLLSWFISDGSLKDPRSTMDGVLWTPKAPPSGRGTLVAIVARDRRGGLDFLVKTLP